MSRRPEGPHFVGDLDFTELLVSENRSLTAAPVTDAVRSPGGGTLSLLVTMFDVGASHPAVIAGRPDWTATQHLSMHTAGASVAGPLVVDNELLRVGKHTVVVAGTAYDAAGQTDLFAVREAIDGQHLPVAASGLVTFARISRAAAPGMEEYDPAGWLGVVRRWPEPSTATATVAERLGLIVVDVDRGQLELHRSPYVTNSIGTIQGGALAVLIEAAAEASCPGTTATDLQIHYLTQVKVGPARTSSRVLRHGVGHRVVVVDVEDAGSDSQLLARATVTLQAT